MSADTTDPHLRITEDARASTRPYAVGTALAALVLAMATVIGDAQNARVGDAVDDTSSKSVPGLEISHGPILGRPGSNQIGVWARTSLPGSYRVFYGTRPDRFDRSSSEIPTPIGNDNTNWYLIRGLEPDTRYYYGVSVSDAVPAPEHRGTFRTLPDGKRWRNSKTNPEGLFNFAFHTGAGNRRGPRSSAPASHATMLREISDEIYFAIHQGNWIHESGRDTTPAEWAATMGLPANEYPEIVRIAPTITGVWENYKRYLAGSSTLAAWHANMPHLFMFDDHEILDGVEGSTQIGLRARRAVLRDIALEAWYDYLGWSNPKHHRERTHFGRARLRKGSDVLEDPKADFRLLHFADDAVLHVHWGTPDAAVNDSDIDRAPPGDPNSRVYGITEVLDAHRLRITPAAEANTTSSYSIGAPNHFSFRVANCEFFVLDTRGQRHRHLPNREKRPGHTMLGERQKTWLKQRMAASRADFLIVVSSADVTIPQPGSNPEKASDRGDESFMGFMAEREEMLDFWDGLSKPVLIFVGDSRNAYSIQVSDNVWEFAACPITSDKQDTLAKNGSRMPKGRFDSAGREVAIRWSTPLLGDTAKGNRRPPVFAVVRVNNISPNHVSATEERWVADPNPQIVVRFHHGVTGELLYSESVVAGLG